MKATPKIVRLFRRNGAEEETCFNIEVTRPLSAEQLAKLTTLLTYAHERQRLNNRSFLRGKKVHEVGPRLAFATADNSNALSILHSIGLTDITRIEESRRSSNGPPLFDRMTECVYPKPLKTFAAHTETEPVQEIQLIEEGAPLLEHLNVKWGLGLDAVGMAFCFRYFVTEEKRNPTNVELIDLAQSLSEHCRHGFWNGKQVIDGIVMPETLFQIAKAPLTAHKGNDIAGFGDNAGIIKGYRVQTFAPEKPGQSSRYRVRVEDICITASAETHNHPSLVEPFQGAATGPGGLLRDLFSPGKGAQISFLYSGYFEGNLLLENFPLPGEDPTWKYPSQFASPREFLIRGSNGASAYANEFGKPTLCGFARAGGILTPWGERRENIKPTLFAGGIGTIRKNHVFKATPRKGMLIVRIGGPAYWVGLGGGAASSMNAGENALTLDFDSVQRADPEMGRRTYQVVVACTEMGTKNPIVLIHDQGAGGLGNMLKEAVGRAGGKIHLSKLTLGDKTLPVKAMWSAEFQESAGILVWKSRLKVLKRICKREHVPCDVLGEITGNGRIVVSDKDGSTPVNLNLRKVLHDLPQKTFRSETPERLLRPPDIDWNTPIEHLIEDVFKQVSVGSKGFLVHKKDRSVGGLVTQQQCCGPLQQPVADVAVSALSSRTFRGEAAALGEQPLKIMVSPEAGGRMCVAEAILNLCTASVGQLADIKLRANWMWPAKRPGEAPFLYRTANAARRLMVTLHCAQNGGKDSSSKSVAWGGQEVKAFGELIITAYAPVRDTRLTLTPDIKLPGESYLGYIDLGQGKYRLGGSALLQSRGQLGNECPDLDDPSLLIRVWNALQELIRRKLLLSYHDISDGGLIACLSEMVISGNCGAHIAFCNRLSPDQFVRTLFAEELGIVFEYEQDARAEIQTVLLQNKLQGNLSFGVTSKKKRLCIVPKNGTLLDIPTPTLFNWWQATSARLEEEQMDPALAKEEARWNRRMVSPPVKLTFTPRETAPWILRKKEKPKVAVIREEGSNGHLEMASIIARSGMEPYDVMMNDLGGDLTSFARFKGMVFVGGFAHRDRFGAGRGWHARISESEQVRVRNMFERFKGRSDTWSLGVCNGCQLGALLGSVPFPELPEERRTVLLRNRSGKFESRWTTILIQKSPAIMFQKMEGTTFGIWEANGEGCFHFPDAGVLESVLKQNLVPMVYVDDTGGATMQYPCNSHCSPFGIAGLCSKDGLHVIMMPHLERVETVEQCGYVPYRLKQTLKASVWLRPFQNLRAWCEQ